MNYAFLFDIDGCLTLPNQTKSVLDTELIDSILEFDYPVAFVTGRSDGWIRKQYRELEKEEYLKIPTYIEFGMAWIDGKSVELQQESQSFLQLRDMFIEKVSQYCNEHEIYFEPQVWYDDYPDHGSLWVEQKHIQLSIAENTNLRTDQLHEIVDTAWKEINDKARILHHHLGVDVIPQGWSKAKATQHFISNISENKYNWYVFGDNNSDREMTQGLSQVEFISTKNNASRDVRDKLQHLSLL